MKQKIMIILTILVLPYCLIYSKVNKTYFNEVKDKINLKNSEKIIFIFLNSGTCSKCIAVPLNIVNSVTKMSKKNQNAKVVVFVSCYREKEINLYKKTYYYVENLLCDTGEVKKKLGLKKNISIAVFDNSGKCSGAYVMGNENILFNKLKKILE